VAFSCKNKDQPNPYQWVSEKLGYFFHSSL
jgi:hypothetical protein